MAKVGRPQKKDNINLTDLFNLASKGLTDKEIAEKFNISLRSLLNYKQDPEFLRILKNGKEIADQRVEKSLFERALGFEHPEEVLFCYKGKIVRAETIKKYPPDVTACIFWLKNRKPEEWRDKVDVEHDMTDRLAEKFKDLSTEQLKGKVNELLNGNKKA